MPKTWLITGSASGIGLSAAELVLARGENLVATARNIGCLMSDIVEPRGFFAKATQRRHRRQYMDFHKLQPSNGAIRLRQRFAGTDFGNKSNMKG